MELERESKVAVLTRKRTAKLKNYGFSQSWLKFVNNSSRRQAIWYIPKLSVEGNLWFNIKSCEIIPAFQCCYSEVKKDLL
uniref:Uncharacterized protein n=1 Tax=Romanomermis culicivorax TaxID=13658 RepID=A0A915K4U5_ROMCU